MATYERICEFCGNEFIAYRRDKRFCCDACRKAAWKKQPDTEDGSGTVPDASQEYVTRSEYEDLYNQVQRINQGLDRVNENLETLTGFFLRWFENQGTQPMTRIQTPMVDMQSLDDIELEISYAGNSENNNSSWNFAISSAATVYQSFDVLPPEIIDYGLRTGRIPADAVKRKVVETIHVPLGGEQPRNTGGPKQMDVPQFDAPDFDLDELQL